MESTFQVPSVMSLFATLQNGIKEHLTFTFVIKAVQNNLVIVSLFNNETNP